MQGKQHQFDSFIKWNIRSFENVLRHNILEKHVFFKYIYNEVKFNVCVCVCLGMGTQVKTFEDLIKTRELGPFERLEVMRTTDGSLSP